MKNITFIKKHFLIELAFLILAVGHIIRFYNDYNLTFQILFMISYIMIIIGDILDDYRLNIIEIISRGIIMFIMTFTIYNYLQKEYTFQSFYLN